MPFGILPELRDFWTQMNHWDFWCNSSNLLPQKSDGVQVHKTATLVECQVLFTVLAQLDKDTIANSDAQVWGLHPSWYHELRQREKPW